MTTSRSPLLDAIAAPSCRNMETIPALAPIAVEVAKLAITREEVDAAARRNIVATHDLLAREYRAWVDRRVRSFSDLWIHEHAVWQHDGFESMAILGGAGGFRIAS